MTFDELDVVEGRTLLHIETKNKGDGSPCGKHVCSLPKSLREYASLFAVAPELLSACRSALEYVKAMDDYPELELNLRNVISACDASKGAQK